MTSESPRLIEPDEFDEMMELLDCYFAYERGGMQARLPFAYDPDTPEEHAVVVEDGQIVSHVAAVRQTLSTGVDGETAECWGIGGVATDRRYRGNGYMTDLLEFWFDRMDDQDVPLSDLSGNRQRYGNFGFEHAGSEYRYSLSERAFDGSPEPSSDVVGFEMDDHLETVHQIHEAEPYRVVRDLAGSQTTIGQRGLETFMYEGDAGPAYLSMSRETRSRTIEEFGGSEEGLNTLLGHVLAMLDLNKLTARVPPWHPLEPTFARHSRFWTARPHRKFRICDLQGVLESFVGQLEKRWLESGRTEAGSIDLGIVDGECARIEYDPEAVSVSAGTASPDIELERTEMASLLFGMPERCESLRSGDPFLETVCPLRYFIWATEHA